jgi:hypothetical protein
MRDEEEDNEEINNNSIINNNIIIKEEVEDKKPLESQTLVEESEQLSEKSNDILPLNSAVIRRIRLNISTTLPSNQTIDNKDIDNREEAMVSHKVNNEESVGSVLQNTMKQKLANVLQSDSPQTQEIVTSNQTSVIDMSLLSENWSSLDCNYQQLIKTQKRNAKKPNIITLNSELWNEFGIKMMAIRELFHRINQTNQSHNKRSLQQTLIEEHKKKLKALEKSPVLHFK